MLILLLDKSGSMCFEKQKTIDSFNAFLREQQRLNGDGKMSLITFSNEFDVVYDNTKLSEVKSLTDNDYSPTGSTSLYDTIHYAIDKYRNEVSPLVVILTDGEDTSSKHYKSDDVKKLIEEKQKNGWQFEYLGVNIMNYNLGIANAQKFGSVNEALRSVSVSATRHFSKN